MSQRRVPVTILTGFLGSGKTTLLNHILNDQTHGMRFAVVENEFGDVGIDEHILSEKSDEQIVEVMNGCICCTVRGDLVVALKKLYGKISQFDAVIIETTGLADPAPVAQTFFVDDDIKKMFVLDGIITVVDTKYIITRLDDERPEGVENEAAEQVAFADRILLNKIDLAKDEAELAAIEKRLKTINPTCTVFRSQQSKIEPQKLIGIRGFSLDRVLGFDPEFLDVDAEHEHDQTVSSTGCKFVGQLNLAKMNRWIGTIMREMGADLYRYKGILSVAGNNRKFVFQGVGMLFDGNFTVPWGRDEVRESRFCFIGKNLDKKRLEDGFMACKCELDLRFKIGDLVFARTGTTTTPSGKKTAEWTPGKIIRTWDDGNPYRIELEDGDGTNVYGPEDTDVYVKSRSAAQAAAARSAKRA